MAEGAAARALRASLKGLGGVERDQAAVNLAERYAALLDAPAPPSSYRAALDRLGRLVESKADENALAKIRDALAAHTVASDLGPKYLQVLQQLGLTPMARGAKAVPPAAPDPVPDPEPAPAPPAPEGKRDELKQRRDARRARLAADPG